MNGDIRWGIMGPGRIAHKFAQAVNGSPNAALQAIGSRDLPRAEAFAAQYGVPRAHGSYEALAADPQLDAIYIATPHASHLECILLCLEHGKAVLCEKPFTINAHQARVAVQKAREKDLFLMEAMWTRFLPAIWTVRSWLHERQIGDLRMLLLDFGFRTTFNTQNRLFDPAHGGGALLDVGVYGVAYASMIFGEQPKEIASYALLGETGVDEESAMIFRYGDGRMASLSFAIRTDLPGEAHILGSEGSLHLPHFWKPDVIRRRRGEVEEVFNQPYLGGGFEHEIAEVGRCLRDGRVESPGMPLDETIAVMETMDRIRAQWGLKYPME